MKTSAIWTFIFVLSIATTCTAVTNQTAYIQPSNLILKLVETSPTTLEGKIEPALGNPSKMEIFFTGSDNVKIKTEAFQIDRLEKEKIFKIDFEKTNSKKIKKSWIKMHVKYLPDFHELIKQVNTDTKSFPDIGERKKLTCEIKSAETKKEKYYTAAIYRFKYETIK